MAAASEPKAEKVKIVFLVPSQGIARGDKATVDAETAERLIANQQAREV